MWINGICQDFEKYAELDEMRNNIIYISVL